MSNNSIVSVMDEIDAFPSNKGGMTGSKKIHFGTYYGKEMFTFINDNDLWDRECGYLRELMYAIRTQMKNHSKGITNEYFILNPKKYYIDKFELKSYGDAYSLAGLWEAIMYLKEFKERLELGWPEVIQY